MDNNDNKQEVPLTEVEHIKEKSRFLRGTINESLIDNITGALHADDTHLIKFHGTYQQSDRDMESERKKQKLEPLYSFMIRVRVPGGIASPAQLIGIFELADTYGNGTIKLTTRQAFQLHGVFKHNLKKTIRKINDTLLDTIAACGDVNRNVMCNPLSEISGIHKEVYADAVRVSSSFNTAHPVLIMKYGLITSLLQTLTRRRNLFTEKPIYPGNSRSHLPFLLIMIRISTPMIWVSSLFRRITN